MENKKELKGYVALNENNEVFYIPEGNSVELTVIRVLKGREFRIINLNKIPQNEVDFLMKI